MSHKTREKGDLTLNKRRITTAVFLLLVAASFAKAQNVSGAFIINLLETKEVTYGQAASLALDTDDINLSLAQAIENGWLPQGADANAVITTGEAALLLSQAFGFPGVKPGAGYLLFKTPHYAVRELVNRGYLPGDTDPKAPVTGEKFLDIASRLLDESPLGYEYVRAPQILKRDAGVIVRTVPVLTGDSGKDTSFDFRADLIPWVSLPIGDIYNFYASLMVSAGYGGDKAPSNGALPSGDNSHWALLFEPERIEFSANLAERLTVSAGRLRFWEQSSFAASGNFDSVAVRAGFEAGTLSAGAAYTGLLYKESAYITMTKNDLKNYHDDDVYFAPKRILAGAVWDSKSSSGGSFSYSLSALAQADLKSSGYLHSQYLEGEASYFLTTSLSLRGQAAAELIEVADGVKPAFAAGAGLEWFPSTIFPTGF
jgi:hypothetical protein